MSKWYGNSSAIDRGRKEGRILFFSVSMKEEEEIFSYHKRIEYSVIFLRSRKICSDCLEQFLFFFFWYLGWGEKKFLAIVYGKEIKFWLS